MKDNRSYTVFYATALGVVCATLLTAAGRFTAPYRKTNAKAEEVRHILGVLGVSFPEQTSPRELLKVFEQNVVTQKRDDLDLYRYASPGSDRETGAVAIPFAGPGLWGPVKGFLALEADMRTIRGVTFYEQEETPGLGGEIGADWFQRQFKGKIVAAEGGDAGIRIVRGRKAETRREVDGITGATMTCNKVEAMLNSLIKRIVEERQPE